MQLQFLGNDLYRDVVSTSLRSMVTRYSNDLSGIFLSFVFEYPITIICLFFYCRLKKQWLALPIVLVLVIELNKNDGWQGGQSMFSNMSTPVFLILLASVSLTIDNWFNVKSLTKTLLFMIVLPFAIGFGTGNPITTAALYSLAPWTLAVALMVIVRSKQVFSYTRLAVVVVMTVCISGQFVTSLVNDPYHLPYSYDKQDIEVKTTSVGPVQVDLLSKAYIQKGRELQEKCGWEDESIFIGEYNNPGLALVLNAKPFGSPWLSNASQLSRLLKQQTLGLETSIVVAKFQGFGVHDVLQTPLDVQKLFPGRNFKLCGEISYPYADQTSLIYVHLNEH